MRTLIGARPCAHEEGVARHFTAGKMGVRKFLLLATCITLCCALTAQQYKKTGVALKSSHNITKTGGTFGLDLSSAFSQSDFECLKNQGYDFAIIRAYQSTGEFIRKSLRYMRILLLSL